MGFIVFITTWLGIPHSASTFQRWIRNVYAFDFYACEVCFVPMLLGCNYLGNNHRSSQTGAVFPPRQQGKKVELAEWVAGGRRWIAGPYRGRAAANLGWCRPSRRGGRMADDLGAPLRHRMFRPDLSGGRPAAFRYPAPHRPRIGIRLRCELVFQVKRPCVLFRAYWPITARDDRPMGLRARGFYPARSSAWPRSARISSICSSPIDRRT